MRGKVKFYIFGNDVTGITPAYAGKSPFSFGYGFKIQDHPRLCGEKLLLAFPIRIIQRITPAYAGKRNVVGTSVQRK